MVTAISTEIIDFSGMSNSEMDLVVSQLKQQGIVQVTLRTNTFGAWTTGRADPYVSKTDTFARKLNAQGIAVHIDMHSWNSQFSSMVSQKQTYINYVRATIAAYESRGTPCDTFQVWNEPSDRKPNGADQFLIDVLDAARLETSKPISGRFMGAYNTVTGTYSKEIDGHMDYICVNMYYTGGSYWNPTIRNSTAENTMLSIIAYAHGLGKQIWITEAGRQYNNPNEETQRAAVAATVQWAKEQGVDLLNVWVSQPDHVGTENYNIFNGSTHQPRPAFYELNTDPYIPPSPPVPDCTVTEDCMIKYGAPNAGYHWECQNGNCVQVQDPEPTPECLVDNDCGLKYGAAEIGYHWECRDGVCVQVQDNPPPPPPHRDSVPAQVGGQMGSFGVAMLHVLWRLREKFISKEVHKKLHPLV